MLLDSIAEERANALKVVRVNVEQHPTLATPYFRAGRVHSSRSGRRILPVDRHALMGSAAAAWINRCRDLDVCGTATGMAQGLRALKRLRPDLVVSEIMRLMKNVGGDMLVAGIRKTLNGGGDPQSGHGRPFATGR